jgi:hypothetical protein
MSFPRSTGWRKSLMVSPAGMVKLPDRNRKSADSLVALLRVLECDVNLVVRARTV